MKFLARLPHLDIVLGGLIEFVIAGEFVGAADFELDFIYLGNN